MTLRERLTRGFFASDLLLAVLDDAALDVVRAEAGLFGVTVFLAGADFLEAVVLAVLALEGLFAADGFAVPFAFRASVVFLAPAVLLVVDAAARLDDGFLATALLRAGDAFAAAAFVAVFLVPVFFVSVFFVSAFFTSVFLAGARFAADALAPDAFPVAVLPVDVLLVDVFVPAALAPRAAVLAGGFFAAVFLVTARIAKTWTRGFDGVAVSLVDSLGLSMVTIDLLYVGLKLFAVAAFSQDTTLKCCSAITVSGLTGIRPLKDVFSGAVFRINSSAGCRHSASGDHRGSCWPVDCSITVLPVARDANVTEAYFGCDANRVWHARFAIQHLY
jgi:hypothetical protein